MVANNFAHIYVKMKQKFIGIKFFVYKKTPKQRRTYTASGHKWTLSLTICPDRPPSVTSIEIDSL
jgi:hypothetical protein